MTARNTPLKDRLPELPELDIDHPFWDLAISASREMPRRLCLKYYREYNRLSAVITLPSCGRIPINTSASIVECYLFRDWGPDRYFTLHMGASVFDLLLQEMEVIKAKFEPLGLHYMRLRNPALSDINPVPVPPSEACTIARIVTANETQ